MNTLSPGKLPPLVCATHCGRQAQQPGCGPDPQPETGKKSWESQSHRKRRPSLPRCRWPALYFTSARPHARRGPKHAVGAPRAFSVSSPRPQSSGPKEQGQHWDSRAPQDLMHSISPEKQEKMLKTINESNCWAQN